MTPDRARDELVMAQVIGVYRARNAPLVIRLVGHALARGWTTSWWALDEAVDALAHVTCGEGPGEKLPLLNEILARSEGGEGWLVVCDDDVVFARGDLAGLVEIAGRAGFGIAQPAHARGSQASYSITGARRLSVARATTFVEVGPVFAVSPAWRARVTPFDAARGMGWGLEHDFRRLRPDGCVLGIVDAVRIRHLGVVGTDYDKQASLARMRVELSEVGARDWRELQLTLGTWRPWRKSAPWRRSGEPEARGRVEAVERAGEGEASFRE